MYRNVSNLLIKCCLRMDSNYSSLICPCTIVFSFDSPSVIQQALTYQNGSADKDSVVSRKPQDKALEIDFEAVPYAVVLHLSLEVGEDNRTKILHYKYRALWFGFVC